MPDLKLFAQRMRQHGANVEERSGKLLGEVFLAVANDVVSGTPIKEGRARRNWQSNRNAPLLSYLDAPAVPAAGEAEALSNAQTVASQLKSGDAAHLTNNAPYIGELNRGASMQAPAMFVQTSIIRAIEQIRGVRLLN